ncbi:MAG: glycogen synthase [Lentisphaeria bacterium]|nr:glycogen synthase [Lentisphaeria bacterium]
MGKKSPSSTKGKNRKDPAPVSGKNSAETGKECKRIFWCTSECTPYAKSGGLADVSASLPAALAERGHEITIIMPYYNWKMNKLSLHYNGGMFTLEVPFAEEKFYCRVRKLELEKNLTYCFIEYDRFFDRPALYDYQGNEFEDNAERFIFFSRACMELIRYLGKKADILHLNDWHTALCAAYLKSPLYRNEEVFKECKSILTLHNVGYQGNFSKEKFAYTGLPWEFFRYDALEYYDRMNFLKGGIALAHEVNTVSPTYAKEILSAEYGCGLESTLQYCNQCGRLRGILNGIDVKEWDPANDKALPVSYSAENMAGKEKAKEALAKYFHISCKGKKGRKLPLFGVISRLAAQKGLDVFADVLEELLPVMEARFILIGAGDPHLEWRYCSLAERFPEKFACYIGMAEEKLAHLLEAGCDFFVMPSRYEPCGLNQMYSMRYGTLPIVRSTGGLADTVKNYDKNDPSASTGFVFYDLTIQGLRDTVIWAEKTYSDSFEDILQMRKTAMNTDFSWDHTAQQYEEMYSDAYK